MEVPDYELPLEAIAQHPVEPRDSARLLVADASGGRRHRTVSDLPSLVGKGDVMVLNTTRVLPARLNLTKPSGGAAEVLLLEPAPDSVPGTWTALVRPGRRVPPGTVLGVSGQGVVEVGDRLSDGRRRVRLLDPEGALSPDRIGSVALPPYIHEPLADPSRYQTVYADVAGSVAAPTAGLHLTEQVLEGCRGAGCEVVGLDLAIGLGTFRPVSTPQAEDHLMHEERYEIPDSTMQACRRADRVIAVGTTTLRALESAALSDKLSARTSLYIYGRWDFQVVDVLLTNFHQPRSTLLLLIESFAGPRWRELYREALAEGYRFLSFGDAMLVGASRPRVTAAGRSRR
jgi:S-adenosylmethionine:tRNA ribosyltransferase-isomerase